MHNRLRHIINYKVLKRHIVDNGGCGRLRHIINYKVLKLSSPHKSNAQKFKTYHKLQGSQTGTLHPSFVSSLRHIINYKVLKPQIGHHRTHTTCDSCNLCTLLFYNQTPVAVNNMTPTFYICQFQLPLLKKYKVYLFILSRLA